MSNGQQKNFTLPPKLSEVWTQQFQKEGSKESSSNCSGALFLYMLMPSHIRDICKECAYNNNFRSAQQEFWNKISSYSEDAEKARNLLAAAQVHEVGLRKKKSDKSARSG